MKYFIGTLIIIFGIILAVYLGIYLMLFGGIMQIINNINPLNAKEIAYGILRILFCELGAAPLYLGFIVGMSIME